MAGRAEPEDPISQPEGPGDRLPEQAGGFSRERFLLRLVALILISEVAIFAVGAAGFLIKARSMPLPEKSLCHRVDSSLEAAFAVALNTLLALLGGRAVGESTK
jgi:hypothetical protein